jgi:hypothetical protein
MVGMRYALWGSKTKLDQVADAAFELIAKGLEPRRRA